MAVAIPQTVVDLNNSSVGAHRKYPAPTPPLAPSRSPGPPPHQGPYPGPGQYPALMPPRSQASTPAPHGVPQRKLSLQQGGGPFSREEKRVSTEKW